MDNIVDKFTFICTADGKTPMFKNLPAIEHEGRVYGLVSPITHASRNIYSAHAVRLGDGIIGNHLVPCYNIAWETDSPEDIQLDDYEYVQDLGSGYDVIRGLV